MPAQAAGDGSGPGGTGRRRGRPAEAAGTGVAELPPGAQAGVSEGAVVMAGDRGGAAASNTGLGGTVPPQGVPAPAGGRTRQDGGEQQALPPALPAQAGESDPADADRPTGRRRRALASANERAAAQEAAPRQVFALPPADADRPADGDAATGPGPVQGPAQGAPAAGHVGQVQARGRVTEHAQAPHAQAQANAAAQAQTRTQVPGPAAPGDAPLDEGRHDAVPHDQAEDHTPPQPHPADAPTGRRRRAGAARPADEAAPVPAQGGPAQAPPPVPDAPVPPQPPAGQGVPDAPSAPDAPQPWPATAAPQPEVAPAAADGATPAPPQGVPGSTPSQGTPLPPENAPAPRAAQPLPAETSAPVDPNSTQGRSISVRTLGQGVPFNRQAVQVQQPSAAPAPQQPGRRRKLGTPPDPRADQAARPHPATEQPTATTQPKQQPQPQPPAPGQEQTSLGGGQQRLAPVTEGAGRSYAIGAPDKDAAEGPEPLDGPGGAVEVADSPRPQPMDDELPPEPLDNPRRLLVWPAPDVSTQQALSDRGYRPVIVHSREEVDAQIAAFPAALFVDPLTGPITRTALQSLRQAAVAAEVPVLVTAGLGQASRDAAYGADPAVLLKALAPRDTEQHPPRVLLIEEHAEIALALTSTLERRGMQVARAASDGDAVALAGQFRPNLVVMDLMQVQRRQEGSAGIVGWLRANGQLNRTPLVVYTAAVDQADLPRLASGETVLFLAERSTSAEVQGRIVELLSRIGTN